MSDADLTALQLVDKHKGIAALVGGFVSVTAGATWWLAKGGAAALVMSIGALSQPPIASTLTGLPAYIHRVEDSLASLAESQRQTQEAVLQIADTLEALRRGTEKVVEWAPGHSQRLTDAVGGCVAGANCTVYFRGRHTQAGAGCDLVVAKPRLLLPDGREFPVSFKTGADRLQLSSRFETIEAVLFVPDFIPVGLVGVVVLTIYADCKFAGKGAVVERETFRLLVEIKPA